MNNKNIDGGTIDNLTSFSVDGPVEFHHITMSGVLSASNAVVVASSPFRLKSFVNSQTASGQFTFVAGDMYFNSNTNKFMGFNGTSHVELG